MKKSNKGLSLINIGFGNVVSASRIIAVITLPRSSPIKRIRDEAEKSGKLIDATQGRKTRAVIVTDSGHIILSALQVETITHRILSEHG